MNFHRDVDSIAATPVNIGNDIDKRRPRKPLHQEIHHPAGNPAGDGTERPQLHPRHPKESAMQSRAVSPTVPLPAPADNLATATGLEATIALREWQQQRHLPPAQRVVGYDPADAAYEATMVVVDAVMSEKVPA